MSALPDPATGVCAGSWPPPFSPVFLDQSLARLDACPAIVIVGPVGTGRHRLATDIAARTAAGGPAPLHHAARHDEHNHPYRTIRQVFPAMCLAAEAAPADVEAAVLATLDGFPDHAPVLVLTDTDLCDAPSLTLLIEMSRTGRIRLIACLTPETVTHQMALLSIAEVVDIPLLDDQQIGTLLRSRFGVRPHLQLISLLAEQTGGSYSALRDVADASFAAGELFIIEDVLALRPGATADDLTWLRAPRSAERLGGGPPITALVELTALLGRLDANEARACFGPHLVDLALTHGTFTMCDGSLALTSTAESTRVRRAMDDTRRRELFGRFAGSVPGTLNRPGVADRAAEWWITAGRALPVHLAIRAAREANLTGRHHQAELYTDPSNNDQHADIALLDRAFALAEIGQDADLGALCARLDPATLTEDELLVYLRRITHVEPSQLRDRLIQRAVASADPETRRRRRAVQTLAGLVDQAFDVAGDEPINKLRSLTFSAQLSPCNRAITFATLSAVLRHSGRPLQAVEAAEFALQILAGQDDLVSAFHLSHTRELHVMALISAVDTDGAEQAFAKYTSGPGQPLRSPMMAALETSLAMLQGDLERALASARLCLAGLPPDDPHHIGGWVEAMLAQILVLHRRPDDARPIVSLAAARPAHRRQLDLERRMLLAWAHDALADPEEALRLLADAADEAWKHGLSLALIEATALSVQIGGPPHLPVLLGAVDNLVDPSGVPLVWQTFARSAHRGDLPSLIALAELADSNRAGRFAAEIAQYVLDTWRRRVDMDTETRDRLQQLAEPASSQRAPRPHLNH